MRRAAVPSLVAALAAAAVLTPTAAASGGLRVSSAADVQFPARALVLTLPVNRALSPSQVRVTENGRPVTHVTVASATATTSRHFGVVLAIDASPRMRRSIDSAMAAARAFAAHRNPHHPLAVVAFNSRTIRLLPLTYSQSAIRDALAKPPPIDLSRHLYDGVSSAITLLRKAGGLDGSVVVISDGSDKESSKSAEDVIAQARAAGIRVYTIGIADADGFDASSLKTLAAGTDAEFTSTRTAAETSAALDQLGQRIASEYLLTYRSGALPRKNVSVNVAVEGVGTASLRYASPSLGIYPDDKLDTGTPFLRSTFAMILVALLCAGLLGGGVALLLRPDPQGVRRRMAQFVTVDGIDPASLETKTRRPARALDEDSEEDKKSWLAKLEDDLEIARVQASARHLITLTVIATVLVFFVLLSASGSVALALLAVFTPFGARSLLNRRLRQLRDEFADQLGDMLQVVASAMRVGQGMVGALSVAVEESQEPMRSELEQVLVDEQLGIPLEDGLAKLGERMDNADLTQLALVANVQLSTGGNTAEVLDRVTESIRERAALRGLIRSLTAQGRLTRTILTILPVAIFLLMLLVNSDYMSPLVDTGVGHFLIAVCVALIFAGSHLIKRIVEIEV